MSGNPDSASSVVPAAVPTNATIDGADVRWSRPASAAEGYEPDLTPDDRRRAAAFRRPADRDRFVTGRRLLADYLCGELGSGPDDYEVHRPTDEPGEWRPVWRPRRPGLPRPPAFSIAHSGDRVLLAVARGPASADVIGVDVEQLPTGDAADRLVDDLVGHALTTDERARLPVDRIDRRIAVVRSFVRKEAVLKAVGFGLAIDPTAVEIVDARSGPVVVRFDSPHAVPVRLTDLDVGEGFVAALAVGR